MFFDARASYGSHMVLQQAPFQANLWGLITGFPANVTVAVTITPANPPIRISAKVMGDEWRVALPPQAAGATPFKIVVEAFAGGVTSMAQIEDVLLGDVWVCSGQSNMAFLLQNAFNGSAMVTKDRRRAL